MCKEAVVCDQDEQINFKKRQKFSACFCCPHVAETKTSNKLLINVFFSIFYTFTKQSLTHTEVFCRWLQELFQLKPANTGVDVRSGQASRQSGVKPALSDGRTQ